MHLQSRYVARGEAKVLVARFQVDSSRGLLQMGIQQATVLRCKGSFQLLRSQEVACCMACRYS